MKPLFADSFFFIALLNRKDAAHHRAVPWSSGHKLLTTGWILVEVADALAAPALRLGVGPLMASLENSDDVEIVPVSPELQQRGLKLYLDRPDKSWSLTDCISFVVMREHGLSDALSGDHHFEQAGFAALLK